MSRKQLLSDVWTPTTYGPSIICKTSLYRLIRDPILSRSCGCRSERITDVRQRNSSVSSDVRNFCSTKPRFVFDGHRCGKRLPETYDDRLVAF